MKNTIKVYFDGVLECGAYIMGANVVVPENYGMGQLVRAIKQAGYKAFKLDTMRVLVNI